MATGLIGTSSAISDSDTTVSGTTLSYTCPASGVRYAVVNIAACVSSEAEILTNNNLVTAGILTLRLGAGANSGDFGGALSESLAYSVVLGPGQTWSGLTTARGGYSSYTRATASLQASVLEVI